MTRHAEILGALKLRRSQQLIKNIQGAPPMGYHLCFIDVALDRNHLDRQCADVDAHERHDGSVLRTSGEKIFADRRKLEILSTQSAMR